MSLKRGCLSEYGIRLPLEPLPHVTARWPAPLEPRRAAREAADIRGSCRCAIAAIARYCCSSPTGTCVTRRTRIQGVRFHELL